jgi:hypothetical protein
MSPQRKQRTSTPPGVRRKKADVEDISAGAVPAEVLLDGFPALNLPIQPPFPPMEAKSVSAIPAGQGWQFEPKWDGFRCLAFRSGDTVALQSKAGQPLGRYFPELVEAFGKALGIYFHNAANAVDNESVQEQGEAESLSKIGTLKQDTHDLEYIMQKCDELTEIVYREVTEKGYSFKTVSIYMVNVDLSGKTRSVTLEQPAKDKETIRRNVRMLFERYLAESPLDLRRVGVRVAAFSKEEPKQKSLTSFFQN